MYIRPSGITAAHIATHGLLPPGSHTKYRVHGKEGSAMKGIFSCGITFVSLLNFGNLPSIALDGMPNKRASLVSSGCLE